MKKKTKLAFVSNWKSLVKYLFVFFFLIAIWSQAQTHGADLVSLDSVISNRLENRGIVYRAPDFGTSYVEEYQTKREFRYDETVQISSWWEEFKSWLYQLWFKFLELLFGAMDSSGVSGFISQLAPYLLLLFFMGVMVWIALKFGAGSNPGNEIRVAGLTNDELLLQRRDLHALAAEALSRQDYRLAVRYRYLEALQLLMHRKLIDWKSFKTNRDYLLELQGNVLQAPFSEVTRIYNFVWYGHFELDEATFVDLESSFHRIKEYA
jgi:hypothetical protein